MLTCALRTYVKIPKPLFFVTTLNFLLSHSTFSSSKGILFQRKESDEERKVRERKTFYGLEYSKKM